MVQKIEEIDYEDKDEEEAMIGAFERGYKKALQKVLEIIDKVLLERRKQINIAYKEDTELFAQLHTFINHFEEKLKQQIEEMK